MYFRIVYLSLIPLTPSLFSPPFFPFSVSAVWAGTSSWPPCLLAPSWLQGTNQSALLQHNSSSSFSSKDRPLKWARLFIYFFKHILIREYCQKREWHTCSIWNKPSYKPREKWCMLSMVCICLGSHPDCSGAAASAARGNRLPKVCFHGRRHNSTFAQMCTGSLSRSSTVIHSHEPVCVFVLFFCQCTFILKLSSHLVSTSRK